MSDNKAYGYAVARIRAMEPLLLDHSVYQRMLDADGAEGALKVLSETPYGRSLSGDASAGKYDAALEAELIATFDEFRSFVPEPELIDIFRVPYDFHNVKVAIKSVINARSGGKKRWDLMSTLGTIPTDKLTASIETEDHSFLPYGLSTVVPECLAVWDQTKDMVEVEKHLDHAMFRVMLKMAEKTGVPGVIDWMRTRIDAENIRNLLRLKRFGFDASDAASFMHEGGTVPEMTLLGIINEPFENWGRMISATGVGEVLSQIQEEEGGVDRLLVDVERALDDYCQSKLYKARYSTSAPENVLAYLWGKEQEMKNIRTIMVSKSTDSAQEETRRLMRHGY